MKNTAIDFEILEDGTVTITTGDLSGPNHLAADELLDQLNNLLGGSKTVSRRDRFQLHTDISHHLHAHSADGHTHT